MVPTHVSPDRRPAKHAGRHAAVALAALLLLPGPACRRPQQTGGDDGDVTERALADVRARYDATDAQATGGWTWVARDGIVFVLIDVQSVVADVVQGRLDLWAVSGQGAAPYGRSAVMPLAASFEAYAFEDLTGDEVPDFFGAVVDSAETAYPVFLPGASGLMVEEMEVAGVGWRFAIDPASLPEVLRGPRGACALKLWGDAPAPDGQPAGWRHLEIRRGGSLGTPTAAPPACAGAAAPGS